LKNQGKIVTKLFIVISLKSNPINVIRMDLDYGRFDPKIYNSQIYNSQILVLAFEFGTGIGESLSNERGYSIKVKDISSKKYKEILWDKIEDMLEIAGYEVNKIKLKLIEGSKIIHPFEEHSHRLP
jgi:hypothetical protein